MGPLIIAVDFDGCLVRHEFPEIGAPVPRAREVLRELVDADHLLILWTCRSDNWGSHLGDAVRLIRDDWGIPLHAVNTNAPGDLWVASPKVYADIYIDDKGLGCPLVCPDDGGIPYVDWKAVRSQLVAVGALARAA